MSIGTSCGESSDRCTCSAGNPGLAIKVVWNENRCSTSTFAFGIRLDDSILSFDSARCSEIDARGQVRSAIFDWPQAWFDGDVIPLRFTTQDETSISHGFDTLIAHPLVCETKTLTPACSVE